MDLKELSRALKLSDTMDAVHSRAAAAAVVKQQQRSGRDSAGARARRSEQEKEDARQEELSALGETLRGAASKGDLIELAKLLNGTHAACTSNATGNRHVQSEFVNLTNFDGTTALHKAGAYTWQLNLGRLRPLHCSC